MKILKHWIFGIGPCKSLGPWGGGLSGIDPRKSRGHFQVLIPQNLRVPENPLDPKTFRDSETLPARGCSKIVTDKLPARDFEKFIPENIHARKCSGIVTKKSLLPRSVLV